MAVVEDAVDESGSHHLVAKDLTPLLEALVGCQDGGGVLVAAPHELEEQHRSRLADRQVTDLIDDQQRRMAEHSEAALESAGCLRLLERGDQICEGAVVDATAMLGGSDCQANGQVGLADAGRPEQDDVLFALEEAELGQAVDLLALDRRLEREVELIVAPFWESVINGRRSRRPLWRAPHVLHRRTTRSRVAPQEG